MAEQDRERMSGTLQENVLVLLCFDDTAASLIRAQVSVQLFESQVYREVAGCALDYFDQFKEAPKDHIPDLLEHLLKGEDRRKAKVYEQLLQNLFQARESVNREYVLSQLSTFVRAQNIKSAIVKAAEAVEDGRVDDAELAMQAGLRSQMVTFDLGLNATDPDALSCLDDEDEESFLCGIPALDAYKVGPARKTLFMLTAPLNKGKSWGLIHLGKWGLLQRLTVVHITLEMSAKKTLRRYYQSLFSISKREAQTRVTRLRFAGGELVSLVSEELDRPSLTDPDIKALLGKKIRRQFKHGRPLIVKEFPTGKLTQSALDAYLDGLERYHKIIPDLVIIDYAELMALTDPKDKRGSIGQLFVGLRGCAVERNLAMATASQVNRDGLNTKVLTEAHLSEDLSKGFTVDTNVTYNQTDMEHQLGLARIYVSKHRDDAAKMTALVTQSYALGQFCLDSVLLPDNYANVLHPGRAESNADQ